eukprot:2778372-Amphidinium_carterae.1
MMPTRLSSQRPKVLIPCRSVGQMAGNGMNCFQPVLKLSHSHHEQNSNVVTAATVHARYHRICHISCKDAAPSFDKWPVGIESFLKPVKGGLSKPAESIGVGISHTNLEMTHYERHSVASAEKNARVYAPRRCD